MSKKKRKPADWDEARRRCRLNDDDIRMAQALGMTAASLVKNIPSRGQMWKLPVKDWLRDLYEEKFGGVGWDSDSTFGGDTEFLVVPEFHTNKRRPAEELRTAAAYVAREFSLLPEVVRVMLFGSVMEPGECGDVDLAVWLTDLSRLNALRNARGEALNRLSATREIGVEASQVDVHILEPGTDRYRGRLCSLGACPERNMDACRADGCGAQPFLRQIPEYRYDRDRMRHATWEILFERADLEDVWMPPYTQISDDDVPF